MFTLSGSAWEGMPVALGPFEDRKAQGRTWVCLLFYPSPPSPQCEKRLSFLGCQGFLSGKMFPLFYLCRRPRPRHSAPSSERRQRSQAGPLVSEPAWQGPAYVLISEKEMRWLQTHQQGRCCCCAGTPIPYLLLFHTKKVSWARDLPV